MPRESLRNYAQRMAQRLPAEVDQWVLAGHSFGGILAQEMTAFLPVQKVFLISSIQDAEENPWFFKILSTSGLHRMITRRFILTSFPFWGSSHGYDTPAAKALFVDMVQGQSNSYLQWAMYQLSRWRGLETAVPIYRIHGTKDQAFPLRYLRNIDNLLPDGDHFLVWKEAALVSRWMIEILQK